MNLTMYLRVSTDRQAEQGFGLTVQRAACQAYAKLHDHTIVATYTDEGVSGSLPAAERPGLRAALDHVRAEPPGGLLVARLDRLARSLTVQEATLALIWKADACIHTADSGEVAADDPDDPIRTLVRQVLGAIAEYDRASITSRMRSGRKAKRASGAYAGDGPPATGYRAIDGALVPDDREQAAVRRAVKLRAMGLSLRAISDSLAIEGYRPKRAERFAPKVLADIIKREETRV